MNLTQTILNEKLKNHQKWLEDPDTGEQLILEGYKLFNLDFQYYSLEKSILNDCFFEKNTFSEFNNFSEILGGNLIFENCKFEKISFQDLDNYKFLKCYFNFCFFARIKRVSFEKSFFLNSEIIKQTKDGNLFFEGNKIILTKINSDESKIILLNNDIKDSYISSKKIIKNQFQDNFLENCQFSNSIFIKTLLNKNHFINPIFFENCYFYGVIGDGFFVENYYFTPFNIIIQDENLFIEGFKTTVEDFLKEEETINQMEIFFESRYSRQELSNFYKNFFNFYFDF